FVLACGGRMGAQVVAKRERASLFLATRSEEHTSELQSLTNLVCRLLLEKKKTRQHNSRTTDDAHNILHQRTPPQQPTVLTTHARIVLPRSYPLRAPAFCPGSLRSWPTRRPHFAFFFS